MISALIIGGIAVWILSVFIAYMVGRIHEVNIQRRENKKHSA